MEELETRLKRHLEIAVKTQIKGLESLQSQVDKLGEELAFDVNRIEKDSKKAILSVKLLKKDRTYTESLL